MAYNYSNRQHAGGGLSGGTCFKGGERPHDDDDDNPHQIQIPCIFKTFGTGNIFELIILIIYGNEY